jgi:hypothetical protein
MTLKRLPVGIQSFTKIIDENHVYADKTKYIYDLLTDSACNFFLSRPRRFGKTLIVNTLRKLFSGNIGIISFQRSTKTELNQLEAVPF